MGSPTVPSNFKDFLEVFLTGASPSLIKALIAVGRKPYTEGLNLSKVGVKKDDKGCVKVNKNFQTDVNSQG